MSIYIKTKLTENAAEIYEQSAVRVGERIKQIRETQEITREELGRRVGLDQNRIQQYENGRRKPKYPLLKTIADALAVDPIALMDPTFNSYVSTMHALFEMEGKLDMRIEIKEGCYCLQFGDGRTGDMNHFLQKWYDARTELEEKLLGLTDEERKREILTYNLYEWNFNGKSD